MVLDRSPANATPGERFMAVQLWVRDGALARLPGRLLVLLSGLGLPTLFITVVLLGVGKRGARRQGRMRAAQLAADVWRQRMDHGMPGWRSGGWCRGRAERRGLRSYQAPTPIS